MGKTEGVLTEQRDGVEDKDTADFQVKGEQLGQQACNPKPLTLNPSEMGLKTMTMGWW